MPAFSLREMFGLGDPKPQRMVTLRCPLCIHHTVKALDRAEAEFKLEQHKRSTHGRMW